LWCRLFVTSVNNIFLGIAVVIGASVVFCLSDVLSVPHRHKNKHIQRMLQKKKKVLRHPVRVENDKWFFRAAAIQFIHFPP